MLVAYMSIMGLVNTAFKITLLVFILVLAAALAPRAFGGSSSVVTVDVSGPGKVHLPDGSDCYDSCQITLQNGEAYQFQAQANDFAKFVSWEGACSGTNVDCTLSPSENMQVSARFDFVNNKKPGLRKARKMTTKNLSVVTSCGGPAPCALVLGGWLKDRGKRLPLPEVFFELEAREKRTVNVLQQAKGIQKKITALAKKGQRSKLQITLYDLVTEKGSFMAINEKPRCCWDKKDKK